MKLRSIKFLFSSTALMLLMASCAEKSEMDKFISDLMNKMTLEEKIGQLNLPVYDSEYVTGVEKNSDLLDMLDAGLVGGVFNCVGVENVRAFQERAVEAHRLHIPLIFGQDVIHGYDTGFPIPLGMAATWDPSAVQEASRIAAIEAAADGLHWTYSPMVDIAHDPRWGRVAEGNGEDPYLGSRMAEAYVNGYQGDLSDSTMILSCVKHFALYGAPDGGRDYNAADMSHARMFNMYMAPYEAAVKAGAASVMSSFEQVDGIPSGSNKWLLTDILRNRWGFDGFVVADYNAIGEMVIHGLGDLETTSIKSLQAGMDMDMVTAGFVKTLAESVKKGLVKESEIDTACRRILEAKYKLGLFTDPYRYCHSNKSMARHPEHLAAARNIAAESFVLLKNNGILPLSKNAKIAVIGPGANDGKELLGCWSLSLHPEETITIVQGLSEASNANVSYARGCNFALTEKEQNHYSRNGAYWDPRNADEMKREALRNAAAADVIVAVLGENAEMSGEGASRAHLEINEPQNSLLRELKKLGKPIVLLVNSGRPLILNWEDENIDAIMEIWAPGAEAGHAVADVLYGDVTPSGKLPISFPKAEGQLPAFYNEAANGRPVSRENEARKRFASNYIDESAFPLYPFGYGLSYTTFEYANIHTDKASYKKGETITVSVDIKNTGKYEGVEVAQLYVRDPVASVGRPVRELKGFERVSLAPGETKTVSFTLDETALGFYDNDLNYHVEPGEFIVFAGGDSLASLQTSFTYAE